MTRSLRVPAVEDGDLESFLHRLVAELQEIPRFEFVDIVSQSTVTATVSDEIIIPHTLGVTPTGVFAQVHGGGVLSIVCDEALRRKWTTKTVRVKWRDTSGCTSGSAVTLPLTIRLMIVR